MSKSDMCNFGASLLKWLFPISVTRTQTRPYGQLWLWSMRVTPNTTANKKRGNLGPCMTICSLATYLPQTSFFPLFEPSYCEFLLHQLSLHPNTEYFKEESDMIWLIFQRNQSRCYVHEVLEGGKKNGCSETKAQLRDHHSNLNKRYW